MEWWQWVLVYVMGYMVTMMLRGLVIPKPVIPPGQYEGPIGDWKLANVFFPLIWPIYGPGLLAWAVGNSVRRQAENEDE